MNLHHGEYPERPSKSRQIANDEHNSLRRRLVNCDELPSFGLTLESRFDDIEWVDDEGRNNSGTESSTTLYERWRDLGLGLTTFDWGIDSRHLGRDLREVELSVCGIIMLRRREPWRKIYLKVNAQVKVRKRATCRRRAVHSGI